MSACLILMICGHSILFFIEPGMPPGLFFALKLGKAAHASVRYIAAMFLLFSCEKNDQSDDDEHHHDRTHKSEQPGKRTTMGMTIKRFVEELLKEIVNPSVRTSHASEDEDHRDNHDEDQDHPEHIFPSLLI